MPDWTLSFCAALSCSVIMREYGPIYAASLAGAFIAVASMPVKGWGAIAWVATAIGVSVTFTRFCATLLNSVTSLDSEMMVTPIAFVIAVNSDRIVKFIREISYQKIRELIAAVRGAKEGS